MKHFSLTALAAATLLCGAMTSCGDNTGAAAADGETLQQRLDNTLASAKTFADSLTAVEGTFIGAFFNAQMSAPNLPKPINKSEFIRGMRDALKCDTADMSYIYGFNSGATALQTYADLAKNEGVNREAFVNTIIAALRLDSVSQEELTPIRAEFENYNRLVAQRAEEKAKEEARNSDTGKANIAAAADYAKRLDGSSDFMKHDSGLYHRVITEGSGNKLAVNERVNVNYTMSHLDGTEISSTSTPRPMYVASPTVNALRSVLPLMKAGETAEFFVPYEHAYGELGNEPAGVGPCESLMIKVTVTPIDAK